MSKIKRKKYRISEIEFYCRCKDHDDKYTHCTPDQQKYEKFYFHKYPNGTFKSGTYKGMDMTFGNRDMYFGILIRSIYDENTKEFIEGPCRTVNKILKMNNCKEVKEFIKDGNNLSVYNDERLEIKFNNELKYKSIYKGPRIGLSDKYPDFKLRNYRYIIYKRYIKKDKKNLQLMI